jgi:hypothetical protein
MYGKMKSSKSAFLRESDWSYCIFLRRSEPLVKGVLALLAT